MKQAPPPVNEADILEEDMARAAHGRLRAWAKALMECDEAFLDTYQNSPGEILVSNV